MQSGVELELRAQLGKAHLGKRVFHEIGGKLESLRQGKCPEAVKLESNPAAGIDQQTFFEKSAKDC